MSTVGSYPVLLSNNKTVKVVVVVEESKLIFVDAENKQKIGSIEFQDTKADGCILEGYYAIFEPGDEGLPVEKNIATIATNQ